MAQQYGTVKVDVITYTSGTGGSETDQSITVSSLATISRTGIIVTGDIEANNITANSGLNVGGLADVSGLVVGNDATITGNLVVGSGISASSLIVQDDATVSGDFGVSGLATVSGLTVTGSTSLNTLTVTGDTNLEDLAVSGNLTVTGNATVSGDITVSGNADLQGNISISGTTDISGDTSLVGNLEVTALGPVSGIQLRDGSSSLASPSLVLEGRRVDNNANDVFAAKVLFDGIRENENVKANKSLGLMAFGGNYVSGQADITYSAGIRAKADDAFTSATGIPTRLEFLTTPSGTSGWLPTSTTGSPGTVRHIITSEGYNLFNIGSGEQSISLGGNLQIFGNTTPSDRTNYWGGGSGITPNDNAAIHMPYGYLGSNGAFRLSLYCNGYRTTASGFEYLDIDGNTNTAAGFDLDPEGYFQFRAGTASGTVLPVVASIYPSGMLIGPGGDTTARLTVNDAGNVSDFYDTTIDTSIFVVGGDATPAQYKKGGSIGFSRLNSSNRMGAAIAARQSGSDLDQMGLTIYTHASTNTGAALNEQLRIDHDGRITIGNNLADSANAAGYKIHVQDNVLGTSLYDKKLFTRYRSTTSNGDNLNLFLSRESTTDNNWTTANWVTQRLVDSTVLTSYGFSHKDTSGGSFFVGFGADPIIKDMEIWRPAAATAANVTFNQNTNEQRLSNQSGPRYEFWSGLNTTTGQIAPNGSTYSLVVHGGTDGLKQVGIGSYDNKSSIQAFGTGTNFNLYINPSNGLTSFNRSNRCAVMIGPTDGNNDAHVYIYGGAAASDPDGKYTTGVNGGIKIRDNSGTSSAPGIVIIGQRNDANGSQSFAGKIGVARLRGDSRLTNNMSCGTVNFGCNHTNSQEANIRYAAAIEARTEGESASAANMPMALLFRTGIAGQDLDTPNVTVGTERMRIKSNGDIAIANQILFGGNTAASDEFDYDTGTFTLHLATTNQPTGSIVSTPGVYVRNGKLITYEASMLANSVNIGSATGNLILRGFPVNGFTGAVAQSFPIAYNGNFGDFGTQWDFPGTTPYFFICDNPSGGGNKIPVSSISGQNIRYYFTFSLALL